MRFIFSGLLLVLLVGCNQSETGGKDAKPPAVADSAEREVELPTTEEPEPELVDLPLKKITAAEASDLLTLSIGHWSSEGTKEQQGRDDVSFRDQWSVR